jgi:hypothetical protein
MQLVLPPLHPNFDPCSMINVGAAGDLHERDENQ